MEIFINFNGSKGKYTASKCKLTYVHKASANFHGSSNEIHFHVEVDGSRFTSMDVWDAFYLLPYPLPFRFF